MGYGIIRGQKVKAGAIGGMESHHARLHESKTNRDIDYSLSKNNYEIISSANLQKRLNARLKELQAKTKTGKERKMRSDAVAAYDFVITGSHDDIMAMSQETRQQYFADAVKFMQERYGAKNVLDAVVHVDEKKGTDHLHLTLVPEKDGRVSAKALFDKKEMRDLQDAFYKQVSSRYNLDRGEVGSKTKHLDSLRFKTETAKAELKKILESIQSDKNMSRDYSKEIDEMKKNVKVTKSVFSSEHAEMSIEAAKKFLAIARKGANAIAAANALKCENDRLCTENEALKMERDKERLLNQDLENLLKNEKLMTADYRTAPDSVRKSIDKYICDTQKSYRAYAHDLNRVCAYQFAMTRDATKVAKQFRQELAACGISEKVTHVQKCLRAAVSQAKEMRKPVFVPHHRQPAGGGWNPPKAKETDYSRPQETTAPALQIRDSNGNEMPKDWNLMSVFERDEQKNKAILREI